MLDVQEKMPKVRVIAKTNITDKKLLSELNTANAEDLVMYCARVSNPKNQTSGKTGLLNYCAEHGHWSIFEMSNMVVEIETSRAIAAQILRHRSFSFQEFSQRYAEAFDIDTYPARSQDLKNRQNSVDNMLQSDKDWFNEVQQTHFMDAMDLYNEALERGIAKEQARFLLPLSTRTKLYMNGTLRSWIHTAIIFIPRIFTKIC